MEYKLITERIHLFEPNIHVCFAIEFCDVLDIDALREAIKKVMYKYQSCVHQSVLMKTAIHFLI